MGNLRHIIFYLFALGTLSCKTKIPDVQTNANSEILTRKNGLQFAGGKLYSGFLIKQNPNGSIGSKQGFLNGKAEGEAVRYYETGQVQELRHFADNHKTGTHKGYFPDGKLMFEYHFEDDLPIDMHKDYYENGQLQAISTYDKSGQPDGLQQQFFKSGKIKANYTLKKGRRYGLMGSKGCMGEHEKVATNFEK